MDPTPTVMSSQGYSPPASAPPAPSPLQSQALTADYGNIDLISYEAGKPSQAPATSRQPLQESTGNAQYQHHQHQHQHQSNHQQQQQQQQQQAHVPTSHYSTGQYPLPSLPSLPSSTRTCAPLHQFGGPLIPPPPTVPTPPSILQSNAASQSHTHHSHAATGPSGGTSYIGLTGSRYRRYHDDYQRRKRDQNPLYACPEFAQYRLKQKDKDRQVWTDDLELFFQDALLQIIFMGRRKFYMSNKQHGRNMIISEYIWHRWLATQPNPEQIDKVLDETLLDKDANKYHPMYRKRKQVSSHIQVQKSFFKYHPAYHFLFCKGEEAGKKDKNKPPMPNRWYKENTDTRPLKCDPVLTALEKGQLPTVRPNYEYFRQLLAMKEKVQLRPSTCWIYVANKYLRDQPSSAIPPTSSDGSLLLKDETKSIGGIKIEDRDLLAPGYTSANANANTVLNTWHTKKGLLFSSEFPHRYAFNNPSSNDGAESPWAPREREVRNIRQTLLHEYTFHLKQTESSSAREVLDEWATEHKELHDMLQSVIDQHDLHNAHALPAGRLCDIFHVDVTLDVHRVHCLPEGTSFEWPFKINVDQPGLQGHDWRVRTFLDRPVELARHKSVKRRNGMVMTRDEDNLMNEMTHVRGCSDDNPQCACRNRHRGPVWLVPIPVNTWAESLDMCAQFPRYLVPKKQDASRKKTEEDMPESETVTQMDLMKATAMFQELWSSAPPTPGMGEQQSWTRRAVICWTFNTIHFFDKDKNLCETPAQTTWRFLSAVDPLSQAHQERIYLPGTAKNDNSNMSPAPAYQQLLNTQIPDNMHSSWNMSSVGVHSAPGSLPVSPMEPYGPSPLHVASNFANGLVTPPASATLPSTYTFEGLSSSMQPHTLPSHPMSYLPSIDGKTSFATGSGFDTDAYFQGSQFNTTFYNEGEDNESDTTLPGESTDLGVFETQQWPSLNSNAHTASEPATLDWNHNGLHSLSMVAEEMAGNSRDPKPNTLDESMQHLQHTQNPYADPFAHLRAVARERRTHSPSGYVRREEQSLRNNFDRRAHHGLPVDDQAASWNTTSETPTTSVQAVDNQRYSQSNSASLNHSTTGAWAAAFSQLKSQLQAPQPPRDEGLAMNEPRALQDYGSSSLGPLLNRKRRREDDEEEEGGRHRLGSMPSYASRDDSSYAPSVDRQEGHNDWS